MELILFLIMRLGFMGNRFQLKISVTAFPEMERLRLQDKQSLKDAYPDTRFNQPQVAYTKRYQDALSPHALKDVYTTIKNLGSQRLA